MSEAWDTLSSIGSKSHDDRSAVCVCSHSVVHLELTVLYVSISKKKKKKELLPVGKMPFKDGGPGVPNAVGQDRPCLCSARTWGRSPAQHRGLKDPASQQLWLRSQLQLRSHPWPGNSICFGAAKKGGKKKMGNQKIQGVKYVTTMPFAVPAAFSLSLSFSPCTYLCSGLLSLPSLCSETSPPTAPLHLLPLQKPTWGHCLLLLDVP